MKSPFMVAFLPCTAFIIILNLTVYYLYAFIPLTLYNSVALFVLELDISWHYPFITLLSMLSYFMAGFIYAHLMKSRYLDDSEVAIEEGEALPVVPSPVGGSARVAVACALVGTLITFPIWFYLAWQGEQGVVILYGEEPSQMGISALLIERTIRQWSENLLIGGVLGTMFGALGGLVVPMPAPPDLESTPYDPQ